MAPPPRCMIYHWKIMLMLHRKGSEICRKLLRLGTNIPPGMNMEEYLNNLPQNSKANYPHLSCKSRKNCFNNSQIDHVRNDPSFERWDITLLALCIKLACEDMAAYDHLSWSTDGFELENCIFKIKKIRNIAMHNIKSWTQGEFLTQVCEMRMLFKHTLREAQKKYSSKFTAADLNRELTETDTVLDSICNEVLGEDELRVLLTSTLQHDLEPMCRKELMEKLDCMRTTNPVSFISGVHLDLNVGLIFTELEIDHPQRRHTSHTDPDQERWVSKLVPHGEYFAEVKNTLGDGYKGIQMVLLEGLAGAGKTTMMRLILQQWCDDHYTIHGLDTYQVVFHVMGRDFSIHSYEDLIHSSLPNTFEKYRDLLKCHLMQCKVLVLLDGFDEGVQNMTTLLKDLLSQGNENMTILCASRPERSTHIDGLGSGSGKNTRVVHTRIVGVQKDKRIEFVKKSHKQLKKETKSEVDTKIVVEQLKELVMNEYFRLPLNLMLAVYLCDQKPSLLTPNTTQTELYFYTFRLTREKLIKLRLLSDNYPQVLAMSEKQMNDSVDGWISHMNKEQFLALSASKLVLDDEAVDRLTIESERVNLPAIEMMSSFLSYKSITVNKAQYSTSHKGLQEYCAACYVMTKLLSMNGPQSVRQILTKHISEGYQNLLIHVLGLINFHKELSPEITDSITREVIDILAESGVESRDQWLDLIEASASDAALKAIASHFKIGDNQHNAVIITDSRATAYRKLLPILSPSWVKCATDLQHLVPSISHHIVMIGEENIDLLEHLPTEIRVVAIIKREIKSNDPILQHLGNYKYTGLHLPHQYHLPCTTDPSTHNCLGNSSSWYQGLVKFTGQLSTSVGERLKHSDTLTHLSLSVASDEQGEALTTIHTLTHLKELHVHVTPAVSASVLTPLPGHPHESHNDISHNLWLSDVSDDKVNWAVNVAAALQPSTWYFTMHFPLGTLDKGGWSNVIRALHKRSVRVEWIRVPGETISDEERGQLFHLSYSTLNAGFDKCGYSLFKDATPRALQAPEVNDWKLDLLGHLPRDTHVAQATINRKINYHDPILEHLGNYKYTKLQLCHQFYHPCTTDPATHDCLRNSSSWYQGLVNFTGQLSTSVRERLQHSDTLTHLSLSVASDEQGEALTTFIHTLAHLKEFHVHVTPAVSSSVLTPLPAHTHENNSNISHKIYLSDVSDDKVDWAVSVAAALQPSTWYDIIHFPRSTLDQDGWHNIIHGLYHHNVCMEKILVPNRSITVEEETHLRHLTDNILDAKFNRWKDTVWEAATSGEPRVQQVNDSDLNLLGHLPRDALIAVDIQKEITCHDPMLQYLGNYKYTKLQLWHQYYHPSTTDPATHDCLKNSSSWYQGLEAFTGQLSTSVGERLQHSDTLTHLSLSVASDEQGEALTAFIHTLTHLKELRVHVTPAVSPSVLLTPLPVLSSGFIPILYLSDVSDDKVDRAVSVAAALQPTTWYDSIHFPRSTLDQGGWHNIIHSLHHHSVRVRDIYVTSDSIAERETTQLFYVTRTTLNAWLYREEYTEWKTLTPGEPSVQQVSDSTLDLLEHLPRDTLVAADIQRDITCHDPILQQLWHQFYHPCTTDPATHNFQGTSSTWYQGLETFTGQLIPSVGERLQHSDTLLRLSLSVASDEQAEALATLLPTLIHLRDLNVHITPAVSTSVLTPIPNYTSDLMLNLYLFLSDVSDDKVDWAVNVAAALQPSTGYGSINFPRGTLDQSGWTDIIHGLHHRSVTVRWLCVTNDSISKEEEIQLFQLTSTTLNAGLSRWDYPEWEVATPGRTRSPSDSDEPETIPSKIRKSSSELMAELAPRSEQPIPGPSGPPEPSVLPEPSDFPGLSDLPGPRDLPGPSDFPGPSDPDSSH